MLVFVEIAHTHTVESDQRVARLQSCFRCAAAFRGLGDYEGYADIHEVFGIQYLGRSRFGNVDTHGRTVAFDGDVRGLVENHRLENPGAIFDRFAGYVDDFVAVAQSDLFGYIVEHITVFDILRGDVVVSPRIADADVDADGQYDVHHDAADHDQQPLPGRFGAELPRLDRLFHLLGIHRLVDHAGNLHIAAERNPSYAVSGFSLFEFEQREPRIEEEVELFHPRAEKAREKEMSEFVYDDQQRETENELKNFDDDIHGFGRVLAVEKL